MITSIVSRATIELFFLRLHFSQEMEIEDTRRELYDSQKDERLIRAQKIFDLINPYEAKVVTKEVNGTVYTFKRRADGIWIITHVEFNNPYDKWHAYGKWTK